MNILLSLILQLYINVYKCIIMFVVYIYITISLCTVIIIIHVVVVPGMVALLCYSVINLLTIVFKLNFWLHNNNYFLELHSIKKIAASPRTEKRIQESPGQLPALYMYNVYIYTYII
jgi:hypothetical protein